LEAWHQPLRFLKESSSSVLGIKIPDLPKISAYHLKLGQPTPSWPSLLRPPIAVTRSTGILTRFPSTTLFSLALGTDSPCVDQRCAGTLGLSACEFFNRIVVTHVTIRTSDTSTQLLNSPPQAHRTLLHHSTCVDPVPSVPGLSPVTSPARADSSSQLCRFL